MVGDDDSIRFDTKRARQAAKELHLTVAQWARVSRISEPTIQKFLRGEALKFRTVDSIARPLGLTAAELILTNGKKRA